MKIRLCLASALAVVLLCAGGVSAGVQYSQFINAEQSNRFSDGNVLFVSGRVRSRLDCAVRCARYTGCETFIYAYRRPSGRGTCRGHSAGVTSHSINDPTEDPNTYFLSKRAEFDTVDPCAAGSHIVIDDYRRDVNNLNNARLCDSGTRFAVGWYRFLINGSSATMPTHCPSSGRCGTFSPMWLDLQNTAMPQVGQEISARTCASWSSQCCYANFDKPVTLRNCGSFYVYYLQKADQCYYSYCAEL